MPHKGVRYELIGVRARYSVFWALLGHDPDLIKLNRVMSPRILHVPENSSRTVRFIVKLYAGDRISQSLESAAEQGVAS